MPYQGHSCLIGQDITSEPLKTLESSLPVGHEAQYRTHVKLLSTWILKTKISWKDVNFLTNFSRTHSVTVSAILNKCRKACRNTDSKCHDQPQLHSRSIPYCRNNLRNTEIQYNIWKNRPCHHVDQCFLGWETGMLLPEQQTGPGKQLFIAESNSVTDCVLICVNFMKVLHYTVPFNSLTITITSFQKRFFSLMNLLFQAVYNDWHIINYVFRLERTIFSFSLNTAH